MNLKKSDLSLISFSAIYTAIFGSGFFRNIDICIYGTLNNTLYNYLEFVGSYAAGLTIFGIYFGQLLVTITLFIGLFSFINNIFRSISLNASNPYIYLFSYLVTLCLSSLYPFYNYYTNALRQGIGLGLTSLFLGLQLIPNNQKANSLRKGALFLIFFLMIFSHKSTTFFCFLLILAFFTVNIIKNIKSNYFVLCSLIITAPISVIFTYISGITRHANNDVIGKDLGLIVSLFSLFVIIALIFFLNYQDIKKFPLFLTPLYQGLGASLVSMPFNTQNVERLFPYFILTILPFFLNIIFGKFKQSYLLIFLIGAIGLSLSLLSNIYTESFSFLNLEDILR